MTLFSHLIIFTCCNTKVIQNIPDVKYTGPFLLYFPVHNGDATASNNSIKKLIVPATFRKSWTRDRIKIKKSEEETFINCAQIQSP